MNPKERQPAKSWELRISKGSIMRNAYIDALYDLAAKDKRILALVADNGAIVYDKFRRAYPDNFLNFGISEANMVSVAAGLAACGRIPFAYTISCFLTMRAYEQIRNDVCLQKMNVKLAGIGAGFVYSNLGPTHHATKDIALMRALPGMMIISPADPVEAYAATVHASRIDSPVYLRLSTGGTPVLYPDNYRFEFGRAIELARGSDITLISTGCILRDVLDAGERLKKDGISASVINMHTIKPLDRTAVVNATRNTGSILTIEEHSVVGGLGSAVVEVIAEDVRTPTRFKRLGLYERFAEGYGTYEDMKEMNGLSVNDITDAAKKLLKD
jgi:transketolase